MASIPTLEQQVSMMRRAVLLFVAHGLVNGVLMASWNSARCVYWNRQHCTPAEATMCSWLSLTHLHVHLLLAATAASTPAERQLTLDPKLCYLCGTLGLGILVQDSMAQSSLHGPLLAAKSGALLVVLGWMYSIVWRQENTWVSILPTPPPPPTLLSARARSSSYDKRAKLPLATMALGLQLMSSMFRVWDVVVSGHDSGVTLNGGRSGTYVVMKNMATCDMVRVVVVLLFAMCYCPVPQQKVLLSIQTVALFASLGLLATTTSSDDDDISTKAEAAGTFLWMLVALGGALS